MTKATEPKTPWQRVYKKFSPKNGSEFAGFFGWDRSKVSRVLRDPDGLISGRDQKAIQRVAKERGVTIDPADMVPANG